MMPSSRRRFLAGVASLSAALAGCNEQSEPSVDGTVTPVDVPRTDEEILREAAAIESPSIPPSVRVSDAHHEAAIEHLESVAEAVRSGLGTLEDRDEEPPDTSRHLSDAEGVLDRTENTVSELRENGPSEEALQSIASALRQVAPLYGAVRVATGDVDRETFLEEVGAERSATAEFRAGFEYRVASPIAESLPTIESAESALDDAPELDEIEELLAEADNEERFTTVAPEVQQRIERTRRRRGDAERFYDTASDPAEPSIETAIESEINRVRERIETIPEQYAELTPQEGDTPAADLHSIRARFVRRSEDALSELQRHTEEGRRLVGLVRAHQWLTEFEAIDTAAERTLDRLDGSEFPTETIVDEKRQAADAVERAAEGTALQRHFASRSQHLLEFADRSSEDRITDSRVLTRTHLTYAGAAEWAERGMERGEILASALRPG